MYITTSRFYFDKMERLKRSGVQKQIFLSTQLGEKKQREGDYFQRSKLSSSSHPESPVVLYTYLGIHYLLEFLIGLAVQVGLYHPVFQGIPPLLALHLVREVQTDQGIQAIRTRLLILMMVKVIKTNSDFYTLSVSY